MTAENILNILRKLAKKEKVKAYLVGGFLRDELLGRKSTDMDLVVYTGAERLAKKLARQTKSSFVLLSDGFKIYRVVFKDGFICDITAGRGKNIEDDLSKRDFTINALAKDLITEELIDIYDGTTDIRAGLIRETTGAAIYKADPLRLLRAVRLAATLNFKISPMTLKNIKANAKLITKPAPERIKDEILKMFKTYRSTEYLLLLDKLGLLERIMPPVKDMKGVSQPGFHHLDVFGHSVETLKRLEEIYAALDLNLFRSKELELDLAKGIKAFIKEKMTLPLGQYDRLTFLKLTALLHDCGKPKTKSKDKKGVHFYSHELEGADIFKAFGKKLRLSNAELDRAATVIKCHLRTGYLAGLKHISKKAIYKFFRDTDDAAIDVLLLSWADRLSARGIKVDRKTLNKHKKIIENLLKEYYKQETEIKPEPLLNGHEIMKKFKLKPSPLVGKLLEKVREAQATGKVSSKEEAYKILQGFCKATSDKQQATRK